MLLALESFKSNVHLSWHGKGESKVFRTSSGTLQHNTLSFNTAMRLIQIQEQMKSCAFTASQLKVIHLLSTKEVALTQLLAVSNEPKLFTCQVLVCVFLLQQEKD